MNRTKKIVTALIFLLLLITVSTNLFAMDYVRGKWNMPGEAMRRPEKAGETAMFAKFNLTEDQKARIEALRDAHRRETKPLQDHMFGKRADLKLLWLQSSPDKEKIMAMQKEIRAIRDQIEDASVAYRLDVFNVLTPEQQSKAKELLVNRGMKPNRDPMGHGPGMMNGF